MGVVWRTTDTTLGRDVAIKLLPEALAADTERMQRFEREARVLASLNHPHIATIHGLHEASREGGRPLRFLVMELVEGEDLQARLARGPVPLERAIEIGTQVALALEAAHGQGIVHRDLKPANVKLTADGNAKVLDFGLAKAFAVESASGEAMVSASMSPTLTSAGTMAGVILGTAAYMSPEQARGGKVDRRADLWAFGCLLFEILTGRRCFEGDTVSDTLASVLKEQPDWSLLPAGTPPAIRRLLRRCLAKDPRQRLGDAADARLELTEALQPPPPEERPSIATAPSAAAPASRLPWIVAAVAIVAAVGAWIVGGRAEPVVAREPMDLAIAFPPGITLNDDQESLLELSRDGRALVFSGFDAETTSSWLFVRDLHDGSLVRLPDTANATNPFFSPDGRWVGFFAEGQMKKIEIGGQNAVPICPHGGIPRGASWGGDDLIVFPAHFSGGLMKVPASGGKPQPLTELDAARKERTHRWPQIVPGHDVVLFTVATTDSPEFYDDARIDAVRLSTGERKSVFEGASFARYVPTGHLIVGRGGFLFAVPFDIDRLQATGPEVLVREGVMGSPPSGNVYAAIAQNGLLAYVPGKPVNSARRKLVWFRDDGRKEPLAGIPPAGYVDPAVSPDGKSIVVAVAGDRAHDLWLLDLVRGSRTRLTFEGDNTSPAWTPDGKSVVFYSVRHGQGAVYMRAVDGSGGERLVYAVEGVSVAPGGVSPDGRLVTISSYGESKTDLYVKSLVDLDAPAVPFLVGPDEDSRARFSPDGRWIVYTSDEAGDYHVFVRPYPGPGGKWQISGRSALDAHWSRDGRQIHYRSNRGWWVTDVDPGDGKSQPFRTGNPRLIRDDLPRALLAITYGIAPDGKALLLAPPEEESGPPLGVTVVTDWFTELERRVKAN